MNIKESFERVGFTPEEKMDLTARLERAAEQEDNMTRATKQRIKKISGGMIFGIAAAVMMTAGAGGGGQSRPAHLVQPRLLRRVPGSGGRHLPSGPERDL